MSSVFRNRANEPFRLLAVAVGILLALLCFVGTRAQARELRVCADPNNLPFSNDRLDGFENKIVGIIAQELEAHVSYVWWAQRRGFVRNTLKTGLCDLVPGTPVDSEMLLATVPYYRSSYVFATREDGPDIASFDDPRLRTARIGVQLIGDDGANSPPAEELSRRGIVGHLVGFPVYGDYALPNPSAPIVAALQAGAVDVAMIWGPQAGYFSKKSGVPLRITPVPANSSSFPMAFAIGMGVRRSDNDLEQEISAALIKHRDAIDTILADYGIPRVDSATEQP